MYYYKEFWHDPEEGFIDADKLQNESDLKSAYFPRALKVYNVAGILGMGGSTNELSPEPEYPIEACNTLIANLPGKPAIILYDLLRSFYNSEWDNINIAPKNTLLTRQAWWTPPSLLLYNRRCSASIKPRCMAEA